MKQKGETLIELMIIACILAILAFIALPEASKYLTPDTGRTVPNIPYTR